METPLLSKYCYEDIHGLLPGDAIIIIGAGHFGRRAARILSQKSDAPILIVDKDEQGLLDIGELSIEKILCDGIHFLVKNFPFLSPSNTIIPAVPVHLAFEWLKSYLGGDLIFKQIQVPEEIIDFLPHTWPGKEGSLLASYANFRCPDDCPEPANYCTVTGEVRKKPLYELLNQLNPLNYKVHIIRSRQIAPGLGGYKVYDLKMLIARIKREGTGSWLVGTACRCHGIVTAMALSAA